MVQKMLFFCLWDFKIQFSPQTLAEGRQQSVRSLAENFQQVFIMPTTFQTLCKTLRWTVTHTHTQNIIEKEPSRRWSERVRGEARFI